MKKREQRIEFTKMHGAGNDYIYVNTLLYNISQPEEVARQLSDRHKGIGADGLVLIGKPTDTEKADFSMRIFNADGSEAMMCGNASRCIGRYVYERGMTTKTDIRLETLSGVKLLRLTPVETAQGSKKQKNVVTVDMGCPRFDVSEQYVPMKAHSPASLGHSDSVFVSMGNPHFVVFVKNLTQVDVAGDGSLLEYDERFPERCNVEFAQVMKDGSIRTRVWERGSGITMACGTGACATAVAAISTGRVDGRKCLIRMDGGDLQVEWDETSGHVWLSGPAEFVFDGEISLKEKSNVGEKKTASVK
ncbi:MAG: diaminopimelate epimerase [Prevotella sp.]|nr:diaminopimelate epimerase [Prevotella sp.]